MKGYVPASVSTAAFNCPHCGTFSSQAWHHAYVLRLGQNEIPRLVLADDVDELQQTRQPRIGLEELDARLNYMARLAEGMLLFEAQGQYTNERVLNLSISSCFACTELSVWRHSKLLYPAASPGEAPSDDMPADVQVDFNEARTILNDSPRGAAALLRLALQKLCVHLGESGKDINKDIGALVAKGLPATIQKALDIVRVVGNESVHPGELDMRDDRDTVLSLLRLINVIIENRITQPRQIDDLYSTLPASKTAGIARRDAGSPKPAG